MGVSGTLRLIFCSVLLAASCGLEAEPISEAVATTAPATTSTLPLAGSSSTQQPDTPGSTAPPLLPARDDAFSFTISTTGESGLVIDGDYVPDEPDGAFRWSSRIDVGDPGG